LRQSQRQPAILEGESLADTPESARKRDWLPGRCGLLPLLLFAVKGTEQEQGLWRSQWLRIRDRKIANRQLASANAARLARKGGAAVGLKRSSAAMR